MSTRGWRGAVLGCAIAAAAGGCEMLAPGFTDEGLLDPSPIARYATGRASITLGDGTKIELGELHGKAELYEAFGASVTWRGSGGWYLQVSASETFGMSGGYLTIERVVDDHHWSTSDGTRCIVDLDHVGQTGVKGTATCKGLEWHDALGAGMGFGSEPIAGEKKFDAEITFEAAPKGQTG